MNVIAYTRVSTDGQVGEDKYGLDAQKEQIQDYCRRNDLTVVKWVSDEGESGAKYRPGFDEIIYGDVTNPPYEGVVVAKSDRVARDINIYFYYKACLLKKDIKLISVAEDFGQFGPFSGILEAFIVCMAQMERENITKRTTGGRKVKAAAGGYSGGNTPFGYKVSDGQMVINPEEARAVRFIFEKHWGGTNMLTITKELAANGFKTRRGGDFAVSTIKSILGNERTYRGEYKYGDGEWVKGQHEPILID